MKRVSIRKVLRIAWVTFGILFLAWNWAMFQSWNLPEDTFKDDADIYVVEDDYKFSFVPRKPKSLQMIFLQGGMTDPKAYAPLCKTLARRGFTCHLLKMPWRLPRYSYQKIASMFDLSAGNYVIGGHSQGAMAAAQFVYENPVLARALVLIGTSHPKDIDLSSVPIPTLKLYASNDGLAGVDEVMENKDKLPRGAQLVAVDGGNHSQFGYLGKLLLDNEATISREVQQEFTASQIVVFLDRVLSEH
jgi:pimeloyl-ACP methyl ester carboxylesterase